MDTHKKLSEAVDDLRNVMKELDNIREERIRAEERLAYEKRNLRKLGFNSPKKALKTIESDSKELDKNLDKLLTKIYRFLDDYKDVRST